MDCCNYGEYRAHGQYGAGAGGAGAWDGYAPYAPLPYAPYAPLPYAPYAPHAHDPYARYYRYDYPAHHPHHSEHVLPMDYGAYASKETRVRRALARRERPLGPQHQPHPPTPPLECGLTGRGPAYCEPQIWSHYQMGALGGGGWGGAAGGAWAARGSCSREHMRYPADCRSIKGPHVPTQNQTCMQEGRSTPYRAYEEPYNGETGARPGGASEAPAASPAVEPARVSRDRYFPEAKRSPVQEKRPPVVPLPAFQQAFGSTEIGKFAEAFSRVESLDEPADAFAYEPFADWEPPEPQWSSQPASREIKCEDNY